MLFCENIFNYDNSFWNNEIFYVKYICIGIYFINTTQGVYNNYL